MKNFYVVGNSHVMYFAGFYGIPSDSEIVFKNENFTFNCFKAGLTGATIYGLENKNSKTNAGVSIENYLNEKNLENLIFVLGDVDFREHLMKRSGSKDEFITNVNSLMQKYKSFIEKFRVSENVMLFEMIPFSREFYAMKIGENKVNEKLFDYFQIFNNVLREFASKNNFLVLSVNDKALDDEGYIKKEFVSHDGFHLNPEITQRVILDNLEILLEKD